MSQNNDVMMMGWLMGGLEKTVQKVRGIADGEWKFCYRERGEIKTGNAMNRGGEEGAK